MTVAPTIREFASREALAAELAETVARHLANAIAARGRATLAVSGGTTPGLFFDALSRQKLDWASVVVTLVDERFVDPSSDRSNEKLVRDRLLGNEARLARFVSLFSGYDTASQAARAAEAAISLFAPPLDVVIIGMGTDGHTASFFPDAEELDALLDPAQPRLVMPVTAASAGEPRLTLTLPVIASARFLALHIEGEAKRRVLETALGDAKPALPIRRVLDAAATTPQIYWAA